MSAIEPTCPLQAQDKNIMSKAQPSSVF